MWLLLFVCEILFLYCSQAVNVKFCVLEYFSVLTSSPLCRSHFRAYDTDFNPDELHLYHIMLCGEHKKNAES
jgi:hypothetical protein